MPDACVTFSSGLVARVLEERRCAKCGAWLTGGDLGHGAFSDLIAGRMICDGKGAGRRRRRVFVTGPLSQKQLRQVAEYYGNHPEFHPLLKWRKASSAERIVAIALLEDPDA